jgi:membrane protease YdiL (CAAX protease family)
MTARETYPLPAEEERELIRSTVISEAVLLGIGIVFAVMMSCLDGGPRHAFLELGVLRDLAAVCKPHWIMAVLPAVMLAVLYLIDTWAMQHNGEYVEAAIRERQGMTGELPRLSMVAIVPCMAVGAIAEELVFRYGILGILIILVGYVVPGPVAASVAVFVSAIMFWYMHARNRDPWNTAVVLINAILWGSAYVFTGSLLSCIVAQAVYNIGELAFERVKMTSEPDYFRGCVPVREALDMQKNRR